LHDDRLAPAGDDPLGDLLEAVDALAQASAVASPMPEEAPVIATT
jgi:hypothetical protein